MNRLGCDLEFRHVVGGSSSPDQQSKPKKLCRGGMKRACKIRANESENILPSEPETRRIDRAYSSFESNEASWRRGEQQKEVRNVRRKASHYKRQVP